MMLPFRDAIDYYIRNHLNVLNPDRQTNESMIYFISYIYSVPYDYVVSVVKERSRGTE